MKRCVKTRHLRHIRKRFSKRADARQVVRLVQGCEGVERGELRHHLGRHTHAAAVKRATVHHTVRDGLHLQVCKARGQQRFEGVERGIKHILRGLHVYSG